MLVAASTLALMPDASFFHRFAPLDSPVLSQQQQIFLSSLLSSNSLPSVLLPNLSSASVSQAPLASLVRTTSPRVCLLASFLPFFCLKTI